jgi:hypothetical protein
MNKPSGMSRKDYHNIRSIIKDFLSSDTVLVVFEDGCAYGFKSKRHDEGYSATTVSVAIGDEPGSYEVVVENRGQDCDGRHSSSSEMVVTRRKNRKRWYWSKNYQTGKPAGKFGIKSAWVSRELSARQRDYTAERMGY